MPGFDYSIPDFKRISGKRYRIYNTHSSKGSAELSKHFLTETINGVGFNKKPSVRIVKINSKAGGKPIWCVYTNFGGGK